MIEPERTTIASDHRGWLTRCADPARDERRLTATNASTDFPRSVRPRPDTETRSRTTRPYSFHDCIQATRAPTLRRDGDTQRTPQLISLAGDCRAPRCTAGEAIRTETHALQNSWLAPRVGRCRAGGSLLETISQEQRTQLLRSWRIPRQDMKFFYFDGNPPRRLAQ